MTCPALKILSKKDITAIQQQTLEHLQTTGITVMHAGGLSLLAEAGARVDFARRLVRLPADLVEHCLALAPGEFTLGGRLPAQDLEIAPGKGLYARNGGGPGHVLDMESGQVRDATLQDTSDYARLVDALPNLDIVAPLYPQDRPAATRDLHALLAMASNCSKHINMRLLNPGSLPYVLEMAVVLAGSRKALRRCPPLTMLESPISPLKLPDVLVDVLLACGEAGIPVEICSMPISGATGPVTLAGALLVSNIEMVASIVISQLANPGSPVIFAPRIMVMEMSSGRALTGSVENALVAAAGVQLAREAYNLPVNMHGPYTDSPASDLQAGMENAYFVFLPALAGATILTGAGHMDGGLYISYPQLVMDNELTAIARRAAGGFAVNKDTLAPGAIARSLEQGNLLMDEHTLQFMRREPRLRSHLLVRQPRQSWLEAGAEEMPARARREAAHLLQTHQPAPLDREVETALGEILGRAVRALEPA